MSKYQLKKAIVSLGLILAISPMASFANEPAATANTLTPPPKPQANLKAEKNVVTADASQTQDEVQEKAKKRAKQRSSNSNRQQQLKDIPDPVDLNSD